MSEKQKLIRTVYLSGPMDFVSEEKAKEWRKRAEAILGKADIDVINPFRKPMPPEGVIQKREVVLGQDLRLIDESDIVLVNGSQSVECFGTAGEAFYSWYKNKPVVAFIGNREKIPVWLAAEAELICRTLEDACAYIINYNHRKIDTETPTMPVEVSQFIKEEEKK